MIGDAVCMNIFHNHAKHGGQLYDLIDNGGTYPYLSNKVVQSTNTLLGNQA